LRRRPRRRSFGIAPQTQPHLRHYRWFLAGAGAWFAGWGVNTVVFSWLVVDVLQAPGRWVGAAQLSLSLPGLVLMLAGGAAADRLDPRRVLFAVQLAAVLPAAALIAGAESGVLTLPPLLIYGAVLGSLQAFVLPARDSLLPRVAGGNLMHAVAGHTVFQFGGLALGNALATQAEITGASAVLTLQALLVLAAALCALRLPRPAAQGGRTDSGGGGRQSNNGGGGEGGQPGDGNDGRQPSGGGESGGQPGNSALADIFAGLRTVARTPALRLPVLLVSAVGILFIGPFMVLFPLVVREEYGGGALRLGIMWMTFPLGTISGSLAIQMLGGVRHKGRAILIALGCGACILLLLSSGLPFALFILGAYAWGLAGAAFINSGRTMMQEAAPAAQRGRVLSAYQFGFYGCNPIGAVLAGYAAEWLGPLHAIIAFGVPMLAVVASAALFSSARRLR